MAIINVGAPACGMNAAMRAFVRMVVTHKFRALAVNQGFQGLLHDEVPAAVVTKGAITSKIKHAIKHKTSPVKLAQLLHNCCSPH